MRHQTILHPDDLLPRRRHSFRAVALGCLVVFSASAGVNRAIADPEWSPRSTRDIRGEIVTLLQHHYYKSIDSIALSRITETNLSAVLDDEYSSVFTAAQLVAWERGDRGDYGGIGIHASRNEANEISIDELAVNGPAARAGIHVGDVITVVAGVPAAHHKVLDVLQRLRGAPGTAVTLSISRGTKSWALTLVRESVAANIVASEIRTDGSSTVGYISVLEFAQSTASQIRAEVDKLRVLHVDLVLLDLRHNPGGLVTEALHSAAIFLPRDSRVFSESGAHIDGKTWSTNEAPSDADTPLAVLVDNQTASASELLAAALRDNGRATIIGSKTFGKGVIQEVFDLPDGGAVKLTTAEYRTPRGQRVNRVGVTPDIEILPEEHERTDTVARRAADAMRTKISRGGVDTP